MKRLFDLALALPAALVTAPLVAGLAAAVKLGSPGPAFFVQERIGRGRRTFRLYKLRTMVNGADRRGPAVTSAGDARITPLGRLLRGSKLDELPQLWNVVRGDMSLVGPRPEAPRYVAHYKPEWAPLFAVRPGITDEASLVFRDEETLLAAAVDRERAYVEVVLPAKLALALRGVARMSVVQDLRVLAETLAVVLRVVDLSGHEALVQARQGIEAMNRLHPRASMKG